MGYHSIFQRPSPPLSRSMLHMTIFLTSLFPYILTASSLNKSFLCLCRRVNDCMAYIYSGAAIFSNDSVCNGTALQSERLCLSTSCEQQSMSQAFLVAHLPYKHSGHLHIRSSSQRVIGSIISEDIHRTESNAWSATHRLVAMPICHVLGMGNPPAPAPVPLQHAAECVSCQTCQAWSLASTASNTGV